MLFQKRIDRAFRRQTEMTRAQEEAAQEHSAQRQEGQPAPADLMEKGDLPAMLLSALLVIVPAALAVLLLMVGIGWLFLRF